MRELQNKQKAKRALYSLPSIVLLLIVTIMLMKGAIGVISKERESKDHLEALDSKITALALREEDLKNDIGRLQTQEGIKDEIRDRFSVIEEGEHVAIIVDDKKTSTSTDLTDKPWYKRLWVAIIGDK